MMLTEQHWTSFDGLDLYGILHQPDTDPMAVIAFIHGHGTHCRRYDTAGLAVNREPYTDTTNTWRIQRS